MLLWYFGILLKSSVVTERVEVGRYSELYGGRTSHEVVRGAREFISRTMKTFDYRVRLMMDYTPNCRCGVQVDR
jgi:hypothetical protein